MDKTITFHITFESLTLAQTAELEEKVEEVLEEYGEHNVEITAIPIMGAFLPPQLPTEE